MMIVTHSRSTVIIVIRYMYFTQLTNWLTKQLTKWEPIDERQRKRAHVGACTLPHGEPHYTFRSKVIIAPDLHKRKGKGKRAFAFTLALPSMAVYLGSSAHSAFIQRADAPRCGPPFRHIPDHGRSTCGGRIKVLAWSASSCVQELSVQGSVWRGTSPPLGGTGPFGQPVQEPRIRDRAQAVPYVRGSDLPHPALPICWPGRIPRVLNASLRQCRKKTMWAGSYRTAINIARMPRACLSRCIPRKALTP